MLPRMENRSLSDVGETPGGLGHFLIRFAMTCVGGYLLSWPPTARMLYLGAMMDCSGSKMRMYPIYSQFTMHSFPLSHSMSEWTSRARFVML